MLSQDFCDDVKANTGFDDCGYNPSLIKGGFIFFSDVTIPASALADMTAFMTYAQAQILVDRPLRWYPLPSFVEMPDNAGGEAADITFGYGSSVKGGETDYSWGFRFVDGAMCLNEQLRKFNRKSGWVVFFDENGTLLTRKKGADYGGIAFKQIFTTAVKIPGATGEVSTFKVVFAVPVDGINKGLQPFKAEYYQLKSLGGIQNVTLELVNRVGAVITVRAKVGCAKSDFYDLYPGILPDPSLWLATKVLNGNAIDIDSVALNANARAFDVTLDTTDTDYAVGVDVYISLASPTVLAAADIAPYESNKVLST